MSALLEAADEADALERLHALGCTDGLPVVIPTAERVARMVLASGQDADLVLGAMGPGGGVTSIEKVAVAAVMAGCLPDHFPVVLAAVKAVLQPAFDLTEMQATTHCTAPLIIVNGPARESCGGVASGFGALGPGHRANASIGRALRLAMINIGGGRPGSSDMALLGHAGKFTYCLAEDEEASPFPPLHTTFGFTPEDSAVTVIGAEAPHSVIYSAIGDAERDVDGVLTALAAGLASLATNNAILTGGQAVVVLNPDHANLLAAAGLDRATIQARLRDRCDHRMGDLRAVAGGFAGNAADDEIRQSFRAPEDLLVLVAGGSGLYSMVMPSWCAGPHRNRAVCEAIETDVFCELPSFGGTP
ncbi:MAG TPA: hypothetical protein VLA56_13365 [Pseudomonadales bacterium]|nr:hypothetical protein [Pseudomonadales bacterium]